MTDFDPSVFARIRQLFDASHDLDPVARQEFLDRECGNDAKVRSEVESLLNSHDAETVSDAAVHDTPLMARNQAGKESENRPTPQRQRTRLPTMSSVTRTIGAKGLSALWIALSLLFLSAFVAWAYVNMSASLRAIRKDELRLLLATNVTAIEHHIELEKTKIRVWAEKIAFRKAVEALVHPPTSDPDNSAKEAAVQILRSVKNGTSDAATYLIWNDRQQVVAASSDYAGTITNRSTAEGAALVTRILDGEMVLLAPRLQEDLVSGHSVELPRPEMAMALPVYDPDDTESVIAAMFVRGIGLEKRFYEMLQSVRAGESGETYAFDASGTMISESRLNKQLREIGLIDDNPDSFSSLTIQIRDPGGNMMAGHRPEAPIGTRPLTKMAAFATAGESGIDLDGYRDYRGVMVVGAWEWLSEYGFGVTTEIDHDEIYRPMRHLNWAFGAIFSLLLASMGVIGYSGLSMARLRRRARDIKQVGSYTLGRLLGEGGIGQVFFAQHALLKRPTAVKLLHPEQLNDETIARFEREVQLASQLQHPNTIEIYDYGQTPEGVFYYAMEYVNGLTLAKLIELERELPAARVAFILESTCKSLREAHGRNLVHRDIKPQNIMLCQRGGESDVVKVLDFGLVKPVESHDATKITKTMGVIGTPLYLAPERLRDPGVDDPRSDIYALGAVGYNLLTGRDIFYDVSDVDVYYHVLNTVPPRVSELLPDVPNELDQMIADCLSKDVDSRPASVDAMLEILRDLASDWTPADADAWWKEVGRTKTL